MRLFAARVLFLVSGCVILDIEDNVKRIIVGKTTLDVGQITMADLRCGTRQVQVLRQVFDHGTRMPYGYEVRIIATKRG